MYYKGKLAGFPHQVVELMLERQVEQGKKRDVTVFEKNKREGGTSDENGFSWSKTVEGHRFWDTVIQEENFDVFFKRYPKAVLPFGVTADHKTSTGYELLSAFKNICQEMGWQYNEKFTTFSKKNCISTPDMYFSNQFGAGIGIPMFSLTHASTTRLYNLPEQWKEAEQEARDLLKYYKEVQKKTVEYTLNSEYKAIINKSENTVKVGCQTFPFSVIEGLVEEFKK